MAGVPPMLPFWLHWYLTAFRFLVKGIPLLLQEQNLRLQPFIFSERLGQSRPTGGKVKRDHGAKIQLSTNGGFQMTFKTQFETVLIFCH